MPERYAVRSFEAGRDEDAWVAVNAAAFASHPEQGALTRRDLEQRMAQPWWDPDGFILIVDASAPDQIAAFHWTKVDPPDGDTGEVYVVGVSPDRQGEGIGGLLVDALLAHAATLDRKPVSLEVRADNAPAQGLYEKRGFRRTGMRRGYYPGGVDAVLMTRSP